MNIDFVLPKTENDNSGLINNNNAFVDGLNASSVQTGTTNYISNIINYANTGIWCSDPKENSYFNITFKRPIFVTNYSFSTYNNWGNPGSYPQNWTVFGIYKRKESIIGDVKESGLNSNNIIRTFKTMKRGPFTALRFTMNGVTQAKGFYFC